ncbi:cob(I)yrinic acid a,c-diamide adenosyltransferase [Candidatus Gottesmanbacteria bacterium]|nr:cob(I)yrinic acid a,c-diamide adenosyltransferase [Candidatus Gottesmanbacteria bacterium]
MRVKIYTKTGDEGKTSLYGGKRVFKNNLRVNSYGTVDELNSILGVVLSKIKDEKVAEFINKIQEDLFLIGSNLAGAKSDLSVLKTRVVEMEKMIDWADAQLPELKNFILPSGVAGATFLFYARAVARRCERILAELNQKEPVDPKLLVYFNRLSDLLFEMARYLNFKAGVKETIWKSR